MRGGLTLPIVAVAVVLAILLCGTTATENPTYQDYTLDSNAALVESPAPQPAQAPVVLDPGSRGDLSAQVTCQLRNILPAARPRNIFRQGVRLILLIPRVC